MTTVMKGNDMPEEQPRVSFAFASSRCSGTLFCFCFFLSVSTFLQTS